MKLDPVRGAKFGALSSVSAGVVLPLNNVIRDEPVVMATVLTGSVIVFFFFGLIGTFTDKLGSDAGDG